MTPLESLESDPPNVWLTSFDGFGPEEWGFVGFASETSRARFIKETLPGVLVLIWASSNAGPTERGKIVGILQCSHELGAAKDFMPPQAYTEKQADEKTRDRWDFGVRAIRAWRIVPNNRRKIGEFAPKTFFTDIGTDRGTFLGSQGDRLVPDEARRLLSLMVDEVDVFGQPPLTSAPHGYLDAVLRPSTPGPVSQNGYWVEPAEGPKHLYVLKLSGQSATLLNDKSAFNQFLIKPGFSGDPDSRCAALNSGLPLGSAFRWSVHNSTAKSGLSPFPTSELAKIGEKAMQDFVLATGGRSLGNEFFLLPKQRIDEVLGAGIDATKGAV